ncbi:MAG: RNA recognition motif domain-containing protein [Cyclobacteriaceae bacterium]|jgi:hypothetical protein|nr:RNA recognition motif domain-containing protein [Cyclobacteriaceae bacterium]
MNYLLTLLLILPLLVQAQTDYSQDVSSEDRIIAALYNVICGEPGEPRDWNRFKYLFTTDAKLIPTTKNQEGKLTYRALSPDEYVQLFSSRIPTGFYERELHRVTEQFGTVTHAFSTYETRERRDGPVTNRGINSIQLFFDGSRYYIMNVFWCAESMGFALPEKYLK